MSGFEVTGVVFGALPLLISGLEHYRDGLDALHTALKYREVIANLVTTFRAIHAAYLTLCERVLRQLMLTDEEYAELLEDPNSDRWRSSEIDVGVRFCLGHNYRPFLEIVARLNQNLIKFATKLDLDPENNLLPRWLSNDDKYSLRKKLAGKSNRLFKSINIGMESGRLKNALDKIDTDLRLLERMIPESVVLPTNRADPRKRSIWKHVRESAKQLFEAMSANWTCANAHSHTASLQLEPRDTSSMTTRSPRFRVLLLACGTSTSNATNSTSWHDVEIESAQEYTVPTVPVPGSSNHPSSTGPKQQRVVSISEITASYSAVTLTVTKSARMADPKGKPLRPIRDLCQCLQSSTTNGCCVGFIEQYAWRHEIFRPRKPMLQPLSWLRLQDAMLDTQIISPQSTPQGQLTLPEKYHVAYTLASSVLQLGDTPWLPDTWGLNDVYYTDARPEFRNAHPYLKNEFPPTPTTHNVMPAKSNRLIPNKMTFALGIVLIELFYEKQLKALRASADLDSDGNVTPMTDQLTATRLLEDIRRQQGDNLADAVQRCLYGSFSSAHDTFDDPTLQGQFYEGVIIPLKRVYDVL